MVQCAACAGNSSTWQADMPPTTWGGCKRHQAHPCTLLAENGLLNYKTILVVVVSVAVAQCFWMIILKNEA